jgi:hypothetical protein
LEEEKQSRKLRGNLLQIPAARQKITPMRTGKSGKIFLVDARRAITRDKPKFPVRSGSFRLVPVRSGSFRRDLRVVSGATTPFLTLYFAVFLPRKATSKSS